MAALLAVLALGGVKWWQGKPLDGAVLAHLTLGHGCSQASSPVRLCDQLESQPLQIVMNNGHGGTPVLTADANGQVTALLPPGDYQVSFSIGNSGSITNHGWGLIHVASGQAVNLGRVQPPADSIRSAVWMQNITQP